MKSHALHRTARPKHPFRMNDAWWAVIGLIFVLVVLAVLIAAIIFSSRSVSPLQLL